MRIGMIGLGRMGGNMVERLIRGGHEVVAYDPSAEARERVQGFGAVAVDSREQLVDTLSSPRVVWIMVPAGGPTEDTFQWLTEHLSAGDTLIDGGNSNFRDSMRRAEIAKAHSIGFIDAGTSGGVWGLANGYCLMVGGANDVVDPCRPLFETLAPTDGYLHVGPAGSGHFVKMIHNGIEYGMLQAYGEGFEIMKQSSFDLNLGEIASLWNHGSVVRSWLLELLAQAYQDNPSLDGIRGYVEDSGEGRWTIEEAIRENVPAPVITLSLLARLSSRQEESYSAQVIAALRQAFGGHNIRPE